MVFGRIINLSRITFPKNRFFRNWVYPLFVYLLILFSIESIMRVSVVDAILWSITFASKTVSFTRPRIFIIGWNLLSLIAIMGLFTAILGNWRRGTALGTLILFFLASICAAKLRILHLPFRLHDLKYTRQMEEFSPLDLWPFGPIGTAWTFFALLAIFCLARRFPVGRINWKIRMTCLLTSVALLLFIHFRGFSPWNPTGSFLSQGFTSSLIRSARFFNGMPAPRGYDEQAIVRIRQSEIQALETIAPVAGGASDRPYYIVYLIGESFCDPLTAFPGVHFKSDPVPRYRNAIQDATRFTMVVPVFGGGTCQTEFETLSGMFTRYMPDHFVFTDFMDNDLQAVPRELTSLGYASSVVHMTVPTMWNYVNAYPRLGFEQFTHRENYQENHSDLKVEKKNTDGYMAKEIIRQMKESSKPIFIYGKSADSHVPFRSSDLPDSPRDAQFFIDNQAISPNADELKGYLKAIQRLDDSMGEILDFLKQSGKPFVFIYVGDHLPCICQNDGSRKPDSVKRSYSVPGFYHSNCQSDPKSENMGYLSAPYLLVSILNKNNIRFSAPALNQALLYFHKYPVMEKSYSMDSKGVTTPLEPNSDFNNNNYWLLEYDLLIGKQFGKISGISRTQAFSSGQ
jgi:hypothetical protein